MSEFRKQRGPEVPRTADDLTSDEVDEMHDLMRMHNPANENSWKAAPHDELIEYLNKVARSDGPGAQEISEWLIEHNLYSDEEEQPADQEAQEPNIAKVIIGGAATRWT